MKPRHQLSLHRLISSSLFSCTSILLYVNPPSHTRPFIYQEPKSLFMQPKPRARIPHTPPSIPYAATPSSRFRGPVAAMALRSLFVKLKDLPRRISISGFGAFVHKVRSPSAISIPSPRKWSPRLNRFIVACIRDPSYLIHVQLIRVHDDQVWVFFSDQFLTGTIEL